MTTIIPCYQNAAETFRVQMAGNVSAAQLPPPSGATGAEQWQEVADRFGRIGGRILQSIKKAETAHRGRAGEAAQSSMQEAVRRADACKQTALNVKRGIEEQSRIQHETFHTLPQEGGKLPDGRPVQMRPPEKNLAESTGLDSVPGFGWTSDYEEQQERFQATSQHAQQVMRDYSSQTDANVRSLPKFEPPPAPAPPPPPPPPGEDGTSSRLAGSSYSSAPSMGGGGAPSGTSSAWAGSPSGGGGYAPAPSGSGAQVPAGTGSAWANSPSGGGLPPGVVRGPDGTLWKQGPNGQWLRQNPYNGRWAPAPQGPPGGGTTTGRGGGAAGGAGGRAGSGFGPRGAGNPLSAGGRSGGGFGPSGSGSPSSTYASNSSSGGRGGMMRGMGGAGGQQQGGDEEEHERPSWLVENEDVFTNDMDRVAPPVLGALPHEQD